MPTDADLKLAQTVGELRAEVSERFGRLEVSIAERFGKAEAELAGFRGAAEKELGIIRKLGAWLLGGVFGLVATLITGAATIGWAASSVVRNQGQRLDKLETRLDAMGKQLDTLISRTAPAPKPGG
jgi:hypothetical protein